MSPLSVCPVPHQAPSRFRGQITPGLPAVCGGRLVLTLSALFGRMASARCDPGKRDQLRDSMGAEIVYRDREWELEGRTTIRRAIRKVGLNPEAVLAVLNGELVTDDRVVGEGDTLKLIAVVSGG